MHRTVLYGFLTKNLGIRNRLNQTATNVRGRRTLACRSPKPRRAQKSDGIDAAREAGILGIKRDPLGETGIEPRTHAPHTPRFEETHKLSHARRNVAEELARRGTPRGSNRVIVIWRPATAR